MAHPLGRTGHESPQPTPTPSLGARDRFRPRQLPSEYPRDLTAGAPAGVHTTGIGPWPAPGSGAELGRQRADSPPTYPSRRGPALQSGPAWARRASRSAPPLTVVLSAPGTRVGRS